MTSSPKSLASTPPMGWNSWNTFGHHIEESLIREVADFKAELKLRVQPHEAVLLKVSSQE